MTKHNWYLIENNSHNLLKFTSEKKLRKYAKENNHRIDRSYLDHYCFMTTCYQYIPGNE